MQIYNNVMTVAIPKNKFFKMISLAKSNDYIRINRVPLKKEIKIWAWPTITVVHTH